MKDIQKIEIESTESIEYFFSGVSFTFDYGKGNAQFRKLSLFFIFLNSRETTLWLPLHERVTL